MRREFGIVELKIFFASGLDICVHKKRTVVEFGDSSYSWLGLVGWIDDRYFERVWEREKGGLSTVLKMCCFNWREIWIRKKGKQVEKVKAYVVACWLGSLWDIEVIAGKHREK